MLMSVADTALTGKAGPLLVATPSVRDRVAAVFRDEGGLGTTWADPGAVLDEELTEADQVLLVVERVDGATRIEMLRRCRALGVEVHLRTIEGIEEEHQAEGEKQLKEDARAERQERARDRARTKLAEEKRAETLDRVAAAFGWQDLAEDWDDDPPAPVCLARTDYAAGLYAGHRTLVIGASESGKSWLMLHAVRQEIDAGHPVVFFDHENGEAVIRDRLRSLGLTREQVRQYLRYAYLDAPLPAELAAELAGKLRAEGGRLVVVDALSPIAHALSLDTSGGDTGAVEEIFSVVLDPWVECGLATVLIDNAPKAAKTGVLGSQHKAAGAYAVLAVVAEDRFSRRHAGRSRIVVAKDRGGALAVEQDGEDRLWGVLQMHPDPTATDRVDVVVTPPPAPAAAPAATIAAVVDIITDTCGLAAEALRRHGLTEVRSMRRLAELMGVVHEIDPARFPAAHTDRERICDCLCKVADSTALAEAGLGVEVIATAKSSRYRVWLTPPAVAAAYGATAAVAAIGGAE
jgi:KaiC/GvpD/RAD55 family RecA-like ATPase